MIRIHAYTYIKNAQLALVIKDGIVEPDEGHVKVGSLMVALLVELVLGVDDDLDDAKGVEVIAEALAPRLELVERGDILCADIQLQAKTTTSAQLHTEPETHHASVLPGTPHHIDTVGVPGVFRLRGSKTAYRYFGYDKNRCRLSLFQHVAHTTIFFCLDTGVDKLRMFTSVYYISTII
jgi:hypothetical protein